MPAASRRLRWSSAAERDLREIWRYYTREASVEVANEVLYSLRSAGLRAAEQPFLHRSREDIGPDLRSVLVHPYVLFYRVADDTIEAVRVLHQRRNIPKILGRSGG